MEDFVQAGWPERTEETVDALGPVWPCSPFVSFEVPNELERIGRLTTAMRGS